MSIKERSYESDTVLLGRMNQIGLPAADHAGHRGSATHRLTRKQKKDSGVTREILLRLIERIKEI